jgi:hypothetical protein
VEWETAGEYSIEKRLVGVEKRKADGECSIER